MAAKKLLHTLTVVIVDRYLDNNQLEDLPKGIFNNNINLKYL